MTNKLSLSKSLQATLLALAGVILFSAKAIFVKKAYLYGIDPVSLLTLRLLFSIPVYLVILALSIRKMIAAKFSLVEYLKVLGLGIIGYYLSSYLDFKGLNTVTASMERLILFVYPTLVLFISWIFFREKATFEHKIAVLVTYSGLLMAFFQNNEFSDKSTWLGCVFIFGSALCYASYMVGSGRLLPRFGTRIFTSLTMIVSTGFATAHFGISNHTSLVNYPEQVYVHAIAMAIFCTVIPSFLISHAIKIIGSPNVSIIGSIGPVSTIVMAFVFLDERIGFFQLLGTIIVISGVMLLVTNKKTLQKQTVTILKPTTKTTD